MNKGPQPGITTTNNLATATAAWGELLPDWLERLAEVCDRSSQTAVAKRLGYSPSVVSGALNGTYRGSLKGFEQAVKGLLMAETVDCPVLGELSSNTCMQNQRKSKHFSSSSSVRVQLYRACRGACVHSRMGGQRK